MSAAPAPRPARARSADPYIRAAVDGAPPLTDEQKAALRALLLARR